MRKTIKMILIVCLTKHAIAAGAPKAKDYHIEIAEFCRRAKTAISLVIH